MNGFDLAPHCDPSAVLGDHRDIVEPDTHRDGPTANHRSAGRGGARPELEVTRAQSGRVATWCRCCHARAFNLVELGGIEPPSISR